MLRYSLLEGRACVFVITTCECSVRCFQSRLSLYLSVYDALTFENVDLESFVFFWFAGTSLASSDEVRISASLGEGRGHSYIKNPILRDTHCR